MEGSLGGLQVLDLTPEGHMHQRIISVGKDPLLDTTHPLYVMSQNLQEDERKAFSFKFMRSLNPEETNSGNIYGLIIGCLIRFLYFRRSGRDNCQDGFALVHALTPIRSGTSIMRNRI